MVVACFMDRFMPLSTPFSFPGPSAMYSEPSPAVPYVYSKAIAEDKVDCTKIKNDTLVGNLKYLMCKKNSDKIDKDGNFKKGTFNIFKKS